MKNFKSLYGFGGRCLKIRDVCMDFEPCFKVHNLVSVHPKSIILGQMIDLDMIFHDGGVSLSRHVLGLYIWIDTDEKKSFAKQNFIPLSTFFYRAVLAVLLVKLYCWVIVIDLRSGWTWGGSKKQFPVLSKT